MLDYPFNLLVSTMTNLPILQQKDVTGGKKMKNFVKILIHVAMEIVVNVLVITRHRPLTEIS